MAAAWQRFWFQPEETSTLAVVRVAFGLVVFAWALTLMHDALDFFAADGLLPEQPGGRDAGQQIWSVLASFHGDYAVGAVVAILLVASACLVLGWHARLAALTVFIGLMSVEQRNPFVFNAGDGLLRLTALYVCLAPTGISLSLDRLRTAKGHFWEFPARAPWALRLMQVQLSSIYISTAWAKLRGTTWNDGTAVSYALRIEDLGRLQLPHVLLNSELLVNCLTYGTLATELALGILVWNKVLRPWVLACGLALHVGIDLFLRIGFFSYAIFVLYIAFAPPERVSNLLLRVRDRLDGWRASVQRRFHRGVEDPALLK
jgi:hypothetical protein